jgi:hypothetical protein
MKLLIMQFLSIKPLREEKPNGINEIKGQKRKRRGTEEKNVKSLSGYASLVRKTEAKYVKLQVNFIFAKIAKLYIETRACRQT